MCGISGIIDRQNTIDPELITHMCQSINHRGPDHSAIWMHSDEFIGLGHCRLSILDLSGKAHQPMYNSELNVCITYNGEIYNFLEIRSELVDLGYCFNTQCDTEVILYAYHAWGMEAVKKFHGMFAFGLYDVQKNKLFLCRDRIGQKPIYYAQRKQQFAFASEIKALLKIPEHNNGINPRALNYYLSYGYVPADLCIINGIHKLLPAHILEIDVVTLEKKVFRYWEIPPPQTQNLPPEEEILYQIDLLIRNAVKERLISDVPLGVFLSGGVDSSLITAHMACLSGQPVKTFSIGFSDPAFNELPYARIVAEHFETDHTEFMVDINDLDIIPNLMQAFDEPIADSSMIPTYYVSKLSRESVTVALSGDGGDECFGGYRTYLLPHLYDQYLSWLPFSMRKNISSIGSKFPGMPGARFWRRLGYRSSEIFTDMHLSHFFTPIWRKKLMNENFLGDIKDFLDEPELQRSLTLQEYPSDLINQFAYSDYQNYLPDSLLVKIDRASMIHSLEVRNPFLDHRLIEYAFQNISGVQKVRYHQTKYLLKKLSRKYLPDKLPIQRKKGFSVPLSRWLKDPQLKKIEDCIHSRSPDLFKKTCIENLFKEHRRLGNHDRRIFSLFVLSSWANTYL